jgi:hypothetical protein
MAIAAFTEFSIFGNGAIIGVNGGAMEGPVGPVIAARGIGNGGCKPGLPYNYYKRYHIIIIRVIGIRD